MATNNPIPTPQHNLAHLRIDSFATGLRYSSPRSGRTERPLAIDRSERAKRLKAELSAAFNAARERVATRQLNAKRKRPGIYVEVRSEPGQQIPELTWMRKGIRLGAVRTEADQIQVASLFVPDAATSFFEEKLEAFGEGTTGVGKIPYRDRFEHLENIQAATLKTLWTDTRPLPTDREAPIWWECWCWRDQAEELRAVAHELNFLVSDRILRFPDLEIVLINGSLSSLEEIIHQSSSLERIRYALDSPAFFTEVAHREQRAWVEDLRGRLVPALPTSPAVCVLDTGATRSHPLLDQSLLPEDCLSVDPAWGTDDSHPSGHGTNMAGVVLYSDLTFPLADQGALYLPFGLESVKIIPPPQLLPNDPKSYGSITQSAVATAEVNKPNRPRTFCMAISNLDVSGEQPTSWSAAIDQICSGATIGDGVGDISRLVVVSAGNIGDHTGPDDHEDLSEFPIEDPAQAWNAALRWRFYEQERGQS